MMDFPRYVDNPLILYDDKCGGDKTKGLRISRLPSQNIVSRLSGRELWGDYRRPGTEKYLQRSMYQSIYPNFTVTQVDKPPCFLRKFTPDGKHFIAFSADQMSIEVYYFAGPQAANHLFVGKGGQWLDALNRVGSNGSSSSTSNSSNSKSGGASKSKTSKSCSPSAGNNGVNSIRHPQVKKLTNYPYTLFCNRLTIINSNF